MLYIVSPADFFFSNLDKSQKTFNELLRHSDQSSLKNLFACH